MVAQMDAEGFGRAPTTAVYGGMSERDLDRLHRAAEPATGRPNWRPSRQAKEFSRGGLKLYAAIVSFTASGGFSRHRSSGESFILKDLLSRYG